MSYLYYTPINIKVNTMIPFKQIIQEQEENTDFEETFIQVSPEDHEELLKIKKELDGDEE